MAASPSLKLVGHDGPDAAGARNERMLALRTRDQRTTVCTQREVERWVMMSGLDINKNAPGGPTYTNRPERRPPQCERSTTCESNLKGGREKSSSAFLWGGTVVRNVVRGVGGSIASRVRKQKASEVSKTLRTHHLPGAFLCKFFLFCALVLFPP
jgi:hypothetical protein